MICSEEFECDSETEETNDNPFHSHGYESDERDCTMLEFLINGKYKTGTLVFEDVIDIKIE